MRLSAVGKRLEQLKDCSSSDEKTRERREEKTPVKHLLKDRVEREKRKK
jgi:hypothetical protein